MIPNQETVLQESMKQSLENKKIDEENKVPKEQDNFSNFNNELNVVPADNLNGEQKYMYAPYN